VAKPNPPAAEKILKWSTAVKDMLPNKLQFNGDDFLFAESD
jgi:hypothetical protein